MSQPTIWITGASSGIGRVFARHYASQGCRLILTARRGDQLEKLAALLGCPCRILSADLSDPAQWDTLCAALETERIDGFINNAGFGLCGAFTETDPAVEQEMLQVNVGALQRLMKFVLGKMQAQGSGFILNVASCAGLMPGGPYMAVYYATKAYVVSLTRAVAQELREQHSPVKVFALCPGPVDTGFNRRANVVFALPGISAGHCVAEALRGMRQGRLIIVPSAGVQLLCTAQKWVPMPVLMPIIARQQKKKLPRG